MCMYTYVHIYIYMCIYIYHLSPFSFLCLRVYVFRAKFGIRQEVMGFGLCKHPILPVSVVIDLLQLFA